jgi:hypothetical protein
MDAYDLAYVSGGHDNRVDRQHRLTWGEVIALCTNFIITPDKESVGLFIPAKFKTPAEPGCDLVPGYRIARRCAENVIHYSMLVADIDGEQTIAEAKRRFRAVRHVGYTSHGSLGAKRGAESFRVVIPLADTMPLVLYRALKPELLSYIGSADTSALSASRAFYLPSCPPGMAPFAECWTNDGDPLDWRPFAAAAEVRADAEAKRRKMADLRRRLAQQERPGTTGDTASRARLLDALKAHFVGYEPTWANVAIAMHREGFTLADFRYVTHGLMREKKDDHCRAKWKHAEHVSGKSYLDMGYLWNVAKGKHDR